jgi:hypothetical protein
MIIIDSLFLVQFLGTLMYCKRKKVRKDRVQSFKFKKEEMHVKNKNLKYRRGCEESLTASNAVMFQTITLI